MTAHLHRLLRRTCDASWRIGATIIFIIGSPSFPAAEAPTIPELRWSATSALNDAEQAYKEGRYQDAIKFYTEASKDLSEQSAALLGRGMAHEVVNQTPKAIEDYKRAIEADRKNYRAMENLAGIYERGGKYISEAVTLYRHALKLDPRPEWQESMAAWIAMLETRLQPQTASAVGCWHLANRKAKAGGVQEAEALYTKAISLNPTMFQAYFNRGLLRRGVGNLTGALADFQATVSISPAFRGGYVQKGLTHEQMGDRVQAKQDFEEAARVDPRDPEALYHLARLLEGTNELGRAAQLYQGALGLRPKPELRKLIVDRISALPASIKADSNKKTPDPERRKQLW
jgi:tetratricopeptide (TPR) repeat protein